MEERNGDDALMEELLPIIQAIQYTEPDDSFPKEVDIAQRDAFGQMLAFTHVARSFDAANKQEVTYNGASKAVLKPFHKDTSQGKSFIYSYLPPLENRGMASHNEYYSYDAIGMVLAQLAPDTIKRVAAVALQIMRQHDHIDALAALERHALDKGGREKDIAMDILVQLVGTAASEAGRGSTGFINILATLHRIKYYDGADLKEALREDFFPKRGPTELQHGTGFAYSERAIRVLSGLMDKAAFNKSLKSDADSVSRAYEKHKNLTGRDIRYFAEASSKDPARQAKYESEAEYQENPHKATFRRKIVRHYESAVSSGKRWRYEAEALNAGTSTSVSSETHGTPARISKKARVEKSASQAESKELEVRIQKIQAEMDAITSELGSDREGLDYNALFARLSELNQQKKAIEAYQAELEELEKQIQEIQGEIDLVTSELGSDREDLDYNALFARLGELNQAKKALESRKEAVEQHVAASAEQKLANSSNSNSKIKDKDPKGKGKEKGEEDEENEEKEENEKGNRFGPGGSYSG